MDDINLSKFELRTDLVMESIVDKEIEKVTNTFDDIVVNEIIISKNQESDIGKKAGIYSTIYFEDITDYENKEKVIKVFTMELKKVLKKLKINENDEGLIIGLGNDKSTPDALGPKTIGDILVTKHIFTLTPNEIEEGFRCVSALNPGVMGSTGIETSDIIRSVSDKIKPKFLIIIDALLAGSIERVNKTIQISTAGIHPGSGVGNYRVEISEQTMEIPVIAIGVPTVVDAATIVSDTIEFMMKNFSYQMNNEKTDKLVPFKNLNYIKRGNKETLNKEQRKKYIGVLGELEEHEIKQLIYEVLLPINYNLIVTPKEVDFLIDKLSNILSIGINQALHKKYEINM